MPARACSSPASSCSTRRPVRPASSTPCRPAPWARSRGGAAGPSGQPRTTTRLGAAPPRGDRRSSRSSASPATRSNSRTPCSWARFSACSRHSSREYQQRCHPAALWLPGDLGARRPRLQAVSARAPDPRRQQGTPQTPGQRKTPVIPTVWTKSRTVSLGWDHGPVTLWGAVGCTADRRPASVCRADRGGLSIAFPARTSRPR